VARSLPFRARYWILALAAMAVAVVMTRGVWLKPVGRWLVTDEGPARADVAVVLAGDYGGQRVLAAAALVRRGYAPAVLVSGADRLYGRPEAELAVEYAVSRGYPRQWFIPFQSQAHNTLDEARAVLPELERRGARSFLLVTSDYHSGRAVRTYRRVLRARHSTIAMRSAAAPDLWREPHGWWLDRESQKTIFMESCKSLASALGI
jgi:uncharacterized SAM-binding protein YcdF (DUF218 family)